LIKLFRKNRLHVFFVIFLHFIYYKSHLHLYSLPTGSTETTVLLKFVFGSHHILSISIYLYSYCSHLEHRASVKRFVSLQFLNPRQSVGLLGWGSAHWKATHYLHRTTQTRNKCRQTSMPWMGFEPTIPVFGQAKTVQALDHVATNHITLVREHCPWLHVINIHVCLVLLFQISLPTLYKSSWR
jgi:hypothetical protein